MVVISAIARKMCSPTPSHRVLLYGIHPHVFSTPIPMPTRDDDLHFMFRNGTRIVTVAEVGWRHRRKEMRMAAAAAAHSIHSIIAAIPTDWAIISSCG